MADGLQGSLSLINCRRCHPLTVLDDHSRFSLVLNACANERAETVQAAMIAAFRHCGLPGAILTDNGPPWGACHEHSWTALGLWLVRLGSPAYHPQTQGKDERFHRTLQFELLRHLNFVSLAHCQREFDQFRDRYNLERPHDALGLATPASRYRLSPIQFPESLPPIEYPAGLEVRKVQSDGRLNYRGLEFRLSSALRGQPVALRPRGAAVKAGMFGGARKLALLQRPCDRTISRAVGFGVRELPLVRVQEIRDMADS